MTADRKHVMYIETLYQQSSTLYSRSAESSHVRKKLNDAEHVLVCSRMMARQLPTEMRIQAIRCGEEGRSKTWDGLFFLRG